MKAFKRSLLALGARRRAGACAGAGLGRRDQDRRRCPTCRASIPTSPAPVRSSAAQTGGRGLGHREARLQGRDRLGRSSEQARRRLGASRAQWYDTDKVDVIVDTCRTPASRSRVNQIYQRQRARRSSFPARRRSDLTGKALLAEHDPLDLRHVDARQRHRRRDRQGRRRHLVLPDRRLRVRPRAASATPRRSC